MEQNLFSIIGLLKQAKIQEMRDRNTEILHASPEYAYWLNKLNEESECKQYKKFKKVKNDHKRLCPNHNDYKSHSKWYGEVGQYYTYKDHLYNISGNVRKSANNNRIYCPASKKSKVLFDSKKAADNFIKFNADDIRQQSGYAPIRSYYCPICGGWHVTSQPEDLTIEKDHMCHAEYVLMKISNMSQNHSITECNYSKFQRMHHDFIEHYKADDIDKSLESYSEMLNFANSIVWDETEIEKVENIMENTRTSIIKLAMTGGNLSDLEKFECLEKDDFVKLSMFATIRNLMSDFDHEIEKGSIDKCREIYNAIYGIKDVDFIPYAKKKISNFLTWAEGALEKIVEETEEMKNYLAQCIENYIDAYYKGDDKTCLKIKLELVSCNVNRYDASTQDFFFNAINLMGGNLSAAC